VSLPTDLDLTVPQDWRPAPMPGANLPLDLVRLASPRDRFTIHGRFPGGFERLVPGGYVAAEEFLVLEGELELADVVYRRGDLTVIPAAYPRAGMRSSEGCRVLAWFGGLPEFLPADRLPPSEGAVVSVAIDAAGDATGWNPTTNNIVYALARNGSTIYAGGAFTLVGALTRNRIAAIDATSGLATAWDPNANATVHALATNGEAVYAGGDFTFIGGQTRNRVASLDPGGLATFTWDPNANSSVYALDLLGNRLDVGGAFNSIAGQGRVGIATIKVPTTVDVPGSGPARTFALGLSCAPNPLRGQGHLRFDLARAASVTLRVYDAAGRRVATLLDRAPRAGGPHAVAIDGTGIAPGIYFVRIEADGRGGTRKVVVVP